MKVIIDGLEYVPAQQLIEPDRAPTVKPWDFTTAPPIVKARRKSDVKVDVAILTGNGDKGFWFASQFYSFSRALDELEQLDGTPLGVKVESEPEWPKYVYKDDIHLLTRFNEDGSEEAIFTHRPDEWAFQSNNRRIENFLAEYSVRRITAAEAADLLTGKDGAK